MNDLISFSQLFDNKIYRIPDYQRGYAWSEDQLNDFWNDFFFMSADSCGGRSPFQRICRDSRPFFRRADFFFCFWNVCIYGFYRFSPAWNYFGLSDKLPYCFCIWTHRRKMSCRLFYSFPGNEPYFFYLCFTFFFPDF